MARKLISEVLTEAGKIVKRDERIKFLQLNKSPGLTDILRINYDETVVPALPAGAPSYRQDDAPKDYQYTILNKAYTQFKYFFKGPIANEMNPLKRESLFLNLLETLHVEEAELPLPPTKGLQNPRNMNEYYKNLYRKVKGLDSE